MEIFVAHHHPTSSSTSSSVTGGNNNNNNNRPFRDHDVREWSRIDAINGVLEKARLETDNWAASTKDSTHRYGKVVDSRARTGIIDGTHLLQAQASKKFEIFQSKSGGNRVQVVKTHSISKWTATTATSSTTNNNNNNGTDSSSSLKAALGFDGLQFPVNPLLDLSSEKSKASVGRTANRRPPSRHHPQQQQNLQFTAATNLHRVSRLCHQIHENAVRNAFGGRKSKLTTPSRRGSADGSVNSSGGVEIVEIENISDTNSQLDRTTKKSNSSDDLQQIPEKDNNNKKFIDDDDDELENWKRDSKLRRSLQSSNSSSSSSNTVKKLRDELDKGRRLSTALKNNSISVDLNALDHIIQSISNVNSSSTIIDDNNLNELLLINEQNNNKKKKRESFVTVESLQEVKGRLKHRSSTSSTAETKNNLSHIDDDGIIVTETDEFASSNMKSYIYGMNNNTNNNNNDSDKMSHKKSVLGDGTGSLESRTKFFNGTNTHKTEDWYNRRKSYGFEKVHEPDETASISSLKDKTLVESSTDSGICRSSEIMIPSSSSSTATKITSNIINNNNGRYNSSDSISESELEKFNNNNNKAFNGINYGNVKKMTSIFDQENKNSDELVNKVWSKRGFSSSIKDHHGEIKSTTITIPIVKNNNVVDLSWNEDNQIMEDLLNRKTKKVEFCKTEVHFAAESGKVNIVETDEKPPPTQNFRRKRRAQLTYPSTSGDFNKTGLPVLHFGDSSFEKSMFGIGASSDSNEEVSHSQNKVFTVVTVNSTAGELSSNNNSEDDKVLKADFNSATENDNLKGILKNKPIKPKSYHLGENSSITQINNNDSEDSDSSSSKWGIKLRHVKDSAPIWKSTVTVHNSDVPEFQKLLKNLKPASPSSPSSSSAKKPDYLSDNENRYSSDSFSNIKMISSTHHRDNRRSSWSVADQIKLVDDDDDDIIQENRGLYSTKVNFGNGEATVVEENEQTKNNNNNNNWQLENLSKDSKQILNRGLVVRIGRKDSISKHTVCSKMSDNSTTTTKITIDLSRSPITNNNNYSDNDNNRYIYTKFNKRSHQQLQHSFKSTPLVLNMLKDQKEAVNSRFPQQLEALKKLYEDTQQSDVDSDADKEVQQLLSRVSKNELNNNSLESEEGSSVVSGSWSKMKSFKNFTQANRIIKSKYDLVNVKDNKDDENDDDDDDDEDKPIATYNKYSIHGNNSKFSPVVLRKTVPIKVNHQQQANNNKSSMNEFRNVSDVKLRAKCANDHHVLRQPKQSEMSYFGVGVTQKTAKVKESLHHHHQKPDLLQNHPSSRIINKPRKPTPEKDLEKVTFSGTSPIYENLKPQLETSTKLHNKKEFDSSILDELTKAADQILQAVNGYTSEDCQNRLMSSDADDEPRVILDTISETKSWKSQKKQELEIKNQQRSSMRPTLASAAKIRVKRTSSTSSVESLSTNNNRRNNNNNNNKSTPSSSLLQSSTNNNKTLVEKSRKKTTSNNNNNNDIIITTSRASSTKARRLQRASSREALLQSHGSSSEDLPSNIEAPLRKPRLIKKTKTAQLTVTNGMEMKRPIRKSREEKIDSISKTSNKQENRILGSLSETRYKSAVSSITNIPSEKSSIRERSKNRIEHKTYNKQQEYNNNKGTMSSSSTRPTTTTTSSNRNNSNNHHPSTRTNKEPNVTQHRISTANIKRCHRSESSTRH